MAVLVVAICGIGYFKAKSALENSISGEIKATLTVESEMLNGWLNEKGRIAQATANLLTEYAGRPEQFDQSMLSLGADDKDVRKAAGTSAGRRAMPRDRSIHTNARGTTKPRQLENRDLPRHMKTSIPKRSLSRQSLHTMIKIIRSRVLFASTFRLLRSPNISRISNITGRDRPRSSIRAVSSSPPPKGRKCSASTKMRF